MNTHEKRVGSTQPGPEHKPDQPALPDDPVNSATYYYAYRPDATANTFELTADMESTKFSQSGSSDVESTDGGNNAGLYEMGSDPGLDL